MEDRMFTNAVMRLLREDDGMEMVEWSIVGVIFALAGALIWGTMKDQVNNALSAIGACVDGGNCPTGP